MYVLLKMMVLLLQDGEMDLSDALILIQSLKFGKWLVLIEEQ